MPQTLLMVGLIVLAGALAGRALAARYRHSRLSRLAHQLGLMYSDQDPFGLAALYSEFLLFSAGHAMRTRNVIYGQMDRWPVRCFEMHYEVGHGPRRQARRYSLVAVATDAGLPETLFWHGQDPSPPLAARASLGSVGPWRICRGGPEASRLAEVFGGLADRCAHVQIGPAGMVLALPGRLSAEQWTTVIRQAVLAATALQGRQ